MQVVVGELLLVKPGSAVPVDGEVVGGSSAVDESMLTGEAVPVAKREGSSVFAGTANQTGVLTLKAFPFLYHITLPNCAPARRVKFSKPRRDATR